MTNPTDTLRKVLTVSLEGEGFRLTSPFRPFYSAVDAVVPAYRLRYQVHSFQTLGYEIFWNCPAPDLNDYRYGGSANFADYAVRS